MLDPDYLIGRFGKVINYSDDAWNGSHVQVHSYNATDSTYKVEYNNGEAVFSLKAHQLELCSPAAFLSRYPIAPAVLGRHDMSETPIGSVVDFSNSDPTVIKTSPQLTIRGSCRIVGKKITQTSKNINTINNHILVKAKDGDLVEFDSLYFESPENSAWNIKCAGGRIAFRNCAFNSSRKGVTIGCGSSTVRVSFESCVFTKLREYAVLVESGFAEFINCAFHSIGRAVHVMDRARIVLHHSNFTNCTGGVSAAGTGHATIFSSQFDKLVDFCVRAMNGASLDLEAGTVNSCTGTAIVVEGGQYADVKIDNWLFKDCKRVAVRIFGGGVKVNLLNNEFEGCLVETYIAVDTKGFISVTNSQSTSLVNKFVNVSGNKCDVRVDKVAETLGTQCERLQRHAALHKEQGVQYHYKSPTPGVCERVLAAAAVSTSVCGKCHSVAPTGTSHKKCSFCKGARYCSRECQKLHWPVHFLLCRVLQLRAKKLRQIGYVSCEQCGKIETVTGSEEHHACSRCVFVFYCSKECQKGAWKSHKAICFPCMRPV